MCNEYIPFQRMTGDGGLHLFIELEEKIHARTLLQKCYEQGVIFLTEMFFILMERNKHISIRIFTSEKKKK